MNDAAVYVEIFGGLANQMFQYAAGRSLADRLGCPLKLDLSAFRTLEKRPYQLDRFGVKEAAAPDSELAPLKSRKGRIQRFLRRLNGQRGSALLEAVFAEPDWHYSPELFEQRPPVVLRGYWQSPRYFAHLRDDLLRIFTLVDGLSSYSQAMRQQITETPAVSIHVRRGDYVANPEAAKVHGTCSLDYYRRAVDLMVRLHPDARFYIFSDDIPFVREAFDFCPNRTIVDGNQGAAAEDMMLMRACNHHIIANSSFSWWGAWLCEAPGKTVIMPRRWFSEESLLRTYTFDLYPDEWLSLG